MKSVDVEGATGYIDTNFDGKCKAAIDEFKNGADFVYIHVEAPDECGHRGEIENKVKAIELIDEHILKPVTDFLKTFDDFAVLVCPDHPTPRQSCSASCSHSARRPPWRPQRPAIRPSPLAFLFVLITPCPAWRSWTAR